MTEPVNLDQARAQCRILDNDSDPLLKGLIAAAREWVENFTGHILVRREITQRFSCFTRPRLYAWPIADDATVAVGYIDSAGALGLVTGARLIFGDSWAEIAPAFGSSWPATYGPVTVVVEAGYPSPAEVPASFKHAILLLVAHWHANREAASEKPITEAPLAVEALCRPYRMIIV